MDTTTNLTEKKQLLEQQLKEIEANFHRVSGAIALLTELINEQEKPKKDNT